MEKLQLTKTSVLHGLLFFGLIISCVYQGNKCVQLYLMGETSVKLIVINAKKKRFPAVSVNTGFRRDVLAKMGLTEEAYLMGEGWHHMNMSGEDVFNTVTRDINDVLESIKLEYDDGRMEEPDFFKKTNSKEIEGSDNRGKSHIFHYEYPATFYPDKPHIGTGTGVSVMKMKFKNDTDFTAMTISLQHAGRLHSPEIKDSTYKIARGMRTVATMRYSIILLLNQPTKYPCIGVPDDENFEFDDCQQDHINMELKKELNCKVPWVINSKLMVCEDRQAKRAVEVYFKAKGMPPCVQPCCTMEVDVNNKFFEKTMHGDTELELRFPPTIKFYAEFEVYGLVSMLAELSGYIGLFLGVSFFDLRHLSDYVKKDKTQKIPTVMSVSPVADLKM